MRITRHRGERVSPLLAFACAATLAAFALLAAGCKSPLQNGASGKKASIRVSVSAPSGKSVVASSDDMLSAISSLSISVVDGSSTTVAQDPAFTYKPGAADTLGSIAPGSYTVAINAYDAAHELIATGTSASITVSMDAEIPVSVPLSFLQAGGAGNFSLAIEWPVSTGLGYVRARVDGTAIAAPSVVTGSTYYSATLADSSLSCGAHRLDIYFMTSSSASTSLGPYIESVNIWKGVTSTTWPEGGSSTTMRTFSAAEFASSDTALSSLSLSGTSLSTSFSPGTACYNFGSALTPSTVYGFTLTADSAAQGLSCTFNGTACALTAASTTCFTGSFTAVSGTNMLTISMTAADRSTVQTYVISTATILTSANFAATIAADMSGSYILSNDISVSATIGNNTTPFSGTLEGNGHTVTLAIDQVMNYAGFFGCVEGTVDNLIIAGSVNGAQNVGGVAGAFGGGTIANCTVIATITGQTQVGGISGSASAGGTVKNCKTDGVFSGSDSIGGIVGLLGNTNICNSFSTASVSGGDDAGGVVGYNMLGTVSNCYSKGSVNGHAWIGGLIGEQGGSCVDCYATGSVTASQSGSGSSLVAYNAGNITLCYDTALTDASYYLPTLNSGVPAGWDTSVWGWSASINGGYPYLLGNPP